MEKVWVPEPVSSTSVKVTNSSERSAEYFVDTFPEWGGHTVFVDKSVFKSSVEWRTNAMGKYLSVAKTPKGMGSTDPNNPMFKMRKFILEHVVKGSVNNGAHTGVGTSEEVVCQVRSLASSLAFGPNMPHTLCKCIAWTIDCSLVDCRFKFRNLLYIYL